MTSAQKIGSPIKNVLSTEWEYLKGHRKTFLLYVTMFFFAGVVQLSRPYILGHIFNTIQGSISSEADLKLLIMKIFLLLLVTVVFWILHGYGRVLEQNTGFLVRKNYINAKLKKVLELPVKWHKDHHSGDTIDKINRGASRLGAFSMGITFEIIYGVVGLSGSLIILFFIDLYAALIAILFSLVAFFIISKVDKKLNLLYRRMNTFGNKAAATLFDYLSNILTVITLRMKGVVTKQVNKRLMAAFETHKKSSVVNEWKWGFASVFIQLMTVLVLSFRAYTDYMTTGIILIGTLYMLYGYLERVGRAFYGFAGLYGTIVRTDAAIHNAKIIDEEYKTVKEETTVYLPEKWKGIRLNNIFFSHIRKGKQLHLSKADINFKRGERIALVGESGSGKSTILGLLRGLNKPNKGRIYCDDELLNNGFSRLKHHITLIPQDPEIFNNNILYNITMGIEVERRDINKAIRISQFRPVLKRLNKGLKTNVLEKGVSLSGGEKQRLAFARGILAGESSEILLMDEPTSSVDSLNEIKIYDKVFKAYKDKTIISSIHRLHLLRKFDRIYFFDKGRIIGEGTLKDLKKNKKFKALWDKYTEKSKK